MFHFLLFVFFFNDTATTEIYTLSLHDALPISANPLYVSSSDLRLTSNSPSRFGAAGGADQGALPYDVVPTPGLHGTLWNDTALTAADGPYAIAGDVTVPADVTLTIEPGAVLSFQANIDIMQAGANPSR